MHSTIVHKTYYCMHSVFLNTKNVPLNKQFDSNKIKNITVTWNYFYFNITTHKYIFLVIDELCDS